MNPMLMALTIVATLLGLAILAFSIQRTLTLLRDSELARLPAVAEQSVKFSETGNYVLHIEQPRLNMAFLHAAFALHDAATGSEVRSSPILFHTRSSGFSTARISLRSFEIEHAGTYRLITTGINAGSDLSKATVIFTRPYGLKLALRILGIVLGGICLLAGAVFSSLLYVGKL